MKTSKDYDGSSLCGDRKFLVFFLSVDEYLYFGAPTYILAYSGRVFSTHKTVKPRQQAGCGCQVQRSQGMCTGKLAKPSDYSLHSLSLFIQSQAV